MIGSKRLRFGAEAVAPLAECLPIMHGAWAHLQHRIGWMCYSRELGAPKLEDVGSEVQSHPQLPREFQDNLDYIKPWGEVEPKLYILAFYSSYYSFHFSILRIPHHLSVWLKRLI